MNKVVSNAVCLKNNNDAKINNEDYRRIGNFVVKAFIRQQGISKVSIKQLTNVFTHLPRTALIQYLDDDKEIVALPGNRYIHRANIVGIDEAAEVINEILETQFRQFDGYTNCHLLNDAVKIDLSLFMNDNAFEDKATIYFVAKHLFVKERYRGNDFVFHGNMHIWKSTPSYPLSIRGVLMNYARQNGGRISRSEGEAFLDKIKMSRGNFTQSVLSDKDSDYLQFIPGEFILTEMLNIDEVWFDQIQFAINELFKENIFIIPRDICEIWYEKLPKPPLGVKWSPLLLQEILINFNSIGYKPIYALKGQSKDTVAAAFVPSSSDMNFSDVAHIHLKQIIDLPKRMGAEGLRSLLCETGMIRGNELMQNMHKALDDYRFAWIENNKKVYIQK
jgi:hypothetical protein